MHTSRPIAVQGRFIGVAVAQLAAWQFIAIHPAVAGLHGASFHSLMEAERRASRVYARYGITADTAHDR